MAGQALAADEDAVATADNTNVSEVVVFGRAEAKIGVAHAASEGTIAGAALEVELDACSVALIVVGGLKASMPSDPLGSSSE